MAVVFGVRASSFSARYSSGGPSGTKFNASHISTAAAGLSGTVIDMTDTAATKYISWPAVHNTPNGRTISLLMRFAPSYTGTPAASRALWALTSGIGNAGAYIELRHDVTTGNLTAQGRNEVLATTLNGSFGVWSPTSGTYYDVVFEWDGTTTASACKLYIDGTLFGSITSAAALSASWDNTWWKSIVVGCTENTTVCAFKLDELIIFDTLQDVTAAPLVGGSGALNGASRTALVDTIAFDGTVSADPGVGNVRSGTTYTISGTGYTGTLVVPALSDTKTGVAGDGGNGTYDGSDRWTSPSAGDLRSGQHLKSNSTSLNLTGTMVAPSLANTKIGVAGDGGNGTYDGSDRWTDPGQNNVRNATAYKANSTSNNKTGNVVLPTVGQVQTGVTFDTSSSLTGTYGGGSVLTDRWIIL